MNGDLTKCNGGLDIMLSKIKNWAWYKKLILFLSVMGPGIIVMMADNDAGGISTYAVTGSKYGFSLLWIFLLLFPIAYYVQEMTIRLGAVTKRGHAEAIFDAFGSFWGWFSLIDLSIVNWLTLVTEYIGMIAAMTIFGIPPIVTYIFVTTVLFSIVWYGKYWTFEKITLFFCVFNLVYIPVTFWAMDAPNAPGWSSVFEGFYNITGCGKFTQDLIFIIMANIGTTIAPCMLFFQQSAVVDKKIDIKDVYNAKLETLIGSFLTCFIAVFIIIATGAAFYFRVPQIIIQDAKQTADVLVTLLPHHGNLARHLFAIGLFDAGFLGAICISLSSSWAVGEVFGWSHSLDHKLKEAPHFYLIYLTMLLTSGAVVLIPHAPLVMITMFVQVTAVTLLPSSLVFLILLLNDKSLMGTYVNTLTQNIINWSIIIFIIIMSSIMGFQTLFPGFFK